MFRVQAKNLSPITPTADVETVADLFAVVKSHDAKFKADNQNARSERRSVGRARTDTEAFRNWFHDDSGELTNPDGTPKVFLRGSTFSGGTSFRTGADNHSGGIFFSTDLDTAGFYAHQYDDDFSMEAPEFMPKVYKSWHEAFEATQDGELGNNVAVELAGPGEWELAVRRRTEKGVRWETLETFPDTAEGLKQFNDQYGQLIRDASVVNPAYMRCYLSAQNTKVIDAEGRTWDDVDSAGLRTNDIARQAWQDGYDMVIVKNVQDGAPTAMEFDAFDNFKKVAKTIDVYIAKDSTQVKSVYNTGSFDATNPDVRYSAGRGAYAYETLTAKPDVKVINIGEAVIYTKGKKIDRAATVQPARAKASVLFNDEHGGQRYVYIPDIAANVLLKTDGVAHGLLGNITKGSTRSTAEVTPYIVDILRNSVAINELNPRREGEGEYSRVLMGCAQNSQGETYLIKSVIRHMADNLSVVESIDVYDVLYSARAKKSNTPLMGSHTGLPAALVPDTAVSDSSISVADLLEVVKSEYPDFLSDDVRAYFGIEHLRKDSTARYSAGHAYREHAPTFFSKMEQEISAFKQAKMGASSVVAYLKGHGVKDEEIKWSGIEQWLEGKKSVTKEELLEFAKLNAIELEE